METCAEMSLLFFSLAKNHILSSMQKITLENKGSGTMGLTAWMRFADIAAAEECFAKKRMAGNLRTDFLVVRLCRSFFGSCYKILRGLRSFLACSSWLGANTKFLRP